MLPMCPICCGTHCSRGLPPNVRGFPARGLLQLDAVDARRHIQPLCCEPRIPRARLISQGNLRPQCRGDIPGIGRIGTAGISVEGHGDMSVCNRRWRLGSVRCSRTLGWTQPGSGWPLRTFSEPWQRYAPPSGPPGWSARRGSPPTLVWSRGRGSRSSRGVVVWAQDG